MISPRKVSTGCNALDELLGGGIPEGSVIIIGGNPGTGKTVFTTQFLVTGARKGEPGVQILYGEDRKTLIDNLTQHLRVDLEALEAKETLTIIDTPTLDEKGVAATLEVVLEQVRKMKAKRLVIDSLTAMLQAYKDPLHTRQFTHTVLNKIIGQLGCTTLLVVEIPLGQDSLGVGVEEFVADGLIILRSMEIDGRPARELEIVKMRGIEVKERRLLYTLEDGFHTFLPFKSGAVTNPQRYQPPEEPKNRFSLGNPQLDELLGGCPKGTTILLEVAAPITLYQFHIFVNLLVWNFLTRKRPVIVYPSVGVDIELIRKRLSEGGIDSREAEGLLKVVVVEEAIPKEKADDPLLWRIEPANAREDLTRLLNWVRSKGKPPLTIIGVDSLISHHGHDILIKAISRTVSEIRKLKGLNLLILKPGIPQTAIYDMCAAIAEIHLRLIREHGVLLFYGIKPRTGLLTVEVDTSKGYPTPKLTPIV
jgi:KaiC/GvpD/RAD55 family RecA-like ATPase